jgi:hypothetical protein
LFVNKNTAAKLGLFNGKCKRDGTSFRRNPMQWTCHTGTGSDALPDVSGNDDSFLWQAL